MEERIPPLRRRVEKKRSPSWLAFVGVFFFFSGVLLILFLRSPLSKVQAIDVVGNRLLSKEQIIHKSSLVKGTSYFSVETVKAEKMLQFLPEVDRVEVKRVFPNKVRIQVQEKQIMALFIGAQYLFYPVLSDGTVLLSRPEYDRRGQLPVLQGWDIHHPQIGTVVKNLSKIPQPILNEIDTIHPDKNNGDRIDIFTKRNHQVVVRANDFYEKMKLYPSFRYHAKGKIYLLESIWFEPENS